MDRIFTQRTTDASYGLAKTGVDLSKQSIDFTKQSDSVADKYRRIELRAYVSVKETKINDFLKDKYLNGIIIIENTGKTPAKKFRCITTSKYNRTHIYSSDFDVIRKYDTAFGISLHPGIPHEIEIQSTNPLNMDSLAIVKKETNFFILALIIYDDVFDTYHETKLAIVYDPGNKHFYIKDIKNPINKINTTIC